MFNTSQFTETNTGCHSYTTKFRDNFNPGVFYTTSNKGLVRRVIEKKIITVNTINNSRKETIKRDGYIINKRDQNGKYIPLMTINSRLARIQSQANKFNKKRSIISEAKYEFKSNELILTTANF